MKSIQKESRKQEKIALRYFILSLAAYTPFFGYTYLKGKLHSTGFENARIDAWPYELVFQAISALNYSYKHFNQLALAKAIWSPLLSVSLTISVFSILWILYLKLRRTINTKEPNGWSVKTVDYIRREIAEKLTLLIAIPSTAIGTFLASFVFLYSTIIIMITGIASLILFMAFGYLIGNAEGNELIQSDVCSVRGWQEYQKRRPGCTEIELVMPFQGEASLEGVRIYASSKATYFLTNTGSYELDSDNKVITYSTIQKNPYAAADKKL